MLQSPPHQLRLHSKVNLTAMFQAFFSVWHGFLWIRTLLVSKRRSNIVFYNLKHAIWPHHETLSGTLVKWHLQGEKKSIQTSLFCHSFNCPSPTSLEPPPTAALPFRRAEEEGSRTGGGGAVVCVCQRDKTRGKCGEVFTDGRGCTRRGWTAWKNPLWYCRVVVVVVVAVIGGRGFPHSSRNNVNVEQAGDRRLVEKETERETRKRKIESDWHPSHTSMGSHILIQANPSISLSPHLAISPQWQNGRLLSKIHSAFFRLTSTVGLRYHAVDYLVSAITILSLTQLLLTFPFQPSSTS